MKLSGDNTTSKVELCLLAGQSVGAVDGCVCAPCNHRDPVGLFFFSAGELGTL